MYFVIKHIAKITMACSQNCLMKKYSVVWINTLNGASMEKL